MNISDLVRHDAVIVFDYIQAHECIEHVVILRLQVLVVRDVIHLVISAFGVFHCASFVRAMGAAIEDISCTHYFVCI